MKTAACYIRVSTEDQLEYSPDAQIRELKKYAASHDIFIDPNHIYIDEGISGRQTKNRTAFLTMIAAAKSKPKPFDAILLWKFSRFARNREDAIVYKSMLRKLGIDVISITESIGDDKLSVLMEAMIEAMDEYYSLNLGEEVRRGMTEKALKGGVQTTPPLGYDKPKDSPVFVINPQEAAIIRLIFDLYLNNHSLSRIARHLNDSSFTTKRGNRFDMRQIEYIINNPVYKGFIRWTPTKTVGLRIYDSPDTITMPGGHQPIIDEDTWDKAHQLYLTRRANRKPHERAADTKRHYLSGLLYCGNCGGKLTYNSHYNAFQCWKYSKGICRTSCFVTVPKLEEQIIAALDQMAANQPFLFYNRTAPTIPDQQNTIVREEIKTLHNVLDKAQRAYLAGIDTLEEYGQTKRSILAKINLLEKKLKPEEPQKPEKVKLHLDSLRKLMTSDQDPAEKNAALSAAFEKIIYTRNPAEKLSVVLR